MKWLERMREKTEAEKRRFALISALIITLLIVIFYFIGTLALSEAKGENGVGEPSAVGPWSELRESFRSVIEPLKERFGNSPNVL